MSDDGHSATWFVQTIQTRTVLNCSFKQCLAPLQSDSLVILRRLMILKKVIENEKAYLKKGYNAYVESVKFHNNMVEKFEDDRVCDKLMSVSYSYEQFLSCFEWWAVAQLD